MDLMRFQAGRPETGTPGPTPPSKSGGGGLAGAYMYFPPPRGVGAKRQNVPLPPMKNFGRL